MLTRQPTDLVEWARQTVLGSKTATLGRTTKMPGCSFGISSRKCKRGAELVKIPGSVCSICYTLSKYYETKYEVKTAHERRWANLGNPDWVRAMTILIGYFTKPDIPFFRWFDSGDIQDTGMLDRIVQVCRNTPAVRHWLPTHEFFIVQEYLASGERFPDNLLVRLSADWIGKPPEHVPGLENLTTSTVHIGHGTGREIIVPGKKTFECPSWRTAARHGDAGRCGSCRACWKPAFANVSYPAHDMADDPAKHPTLPLITLGPAKPKIEFRNPAPAQNPAQPSDGDRTENHQCRFSFLEK